MAAPLPRLRYFMFPGRAYACRIALYNALGKDGWIDERVGQLAFKKLKSQALEERKVSYSAISTSTQLATDNLPQLILPSNSREIVITQSHAIARWAARLTGGQYQLYPTGNNNEDLLAALLVDETMALVDAMVGFAPKDADKNIRLQKRLEYSTSETGLLRLGFAHLEARLSKSNNGTSGDFLLGSGPEKLSIGDLYLKKPLTDMIHDGQFEGVDKEYVKKHFPNVYDHAHRVAEHPLVKEYAQHYKN